MAVEKVTGPTYNTNGGERFRLPGDPGNGNLSPPLVLYVGPVTASTAILQFFNYLARI